MIITISLLLIFGLSYYHYTLDQPEAISLPVFKNTKIEAVEKTQVAKKSQEIEESQETEVQINTAPVYHSHIDKHNNIFGQTILGGYCLSSHYNAQLAARSINNTIIQPQKVFSFNSKAGPYTANRGYVAGTVIVNNRYTQGMGGGVCRISTALYNAALDAGLSIVESHRHTMPIGYAKPGKDAAVAYGILDLKVKNNKENPVQIVTKTVNGIIYVAFIEVLQAGEKAGAEEVELENHIQKTEDESDQEEIQEEIIDVEKEEIIDKKGEC